MNSSSKTKEVAEPEGENLSLVDKTQSSPGAEYPGSPSVKVENPKFIYVLAVLSAIGGFLFGYDTGVVSGAMLLVRKEFELNITWHEAIVSATIGAAWIFALAGGYFCDKVGRKPVIAAASVVFTVGSIVMGAANDKETLLVGRIIVGIGIGLASMGVPLYIAEAASPSARGFLVTLNNIFITGGQFIAAVTCGALAHHYDGWRYMLGIAAVPALLQLIGFFFMPESPRWLVSRGRFDDARKVLQRIRGISYDVEDELDAIRTSCEEADRETRIRKEDGRSRLAVLQILQTPSVRRALILGCLLQMFQQISGINTVMYYSASIIQMAGFHDTSMAIWLSALTAATNFLCTFIGLYLVEKAGRRTLTIASLIGTALSLVFLGIGFVLVSSHTPNVELFSEDRADDICSFAATCGECISTSSAECGFCYLDDPGTGPTASYCVKASEAHSATYAEYGPCSNTSMTELTSAGTRVWAFNFCPSPYGWITILGLVTYLFFFAPGMGPMPWTINSEIYPLWARGTCNSIATSTNWFFNLLVSMTFLTLTEFITREGAFFFYAGLSFVGVVIFWFILPETRGKSLEEMELLFARPWSLSNLCSARRTEGSSQDEPGSKTVQYVQIRGLNRDHHDTEDEDD